LNPVITGCTPRFRGSLADSILLQPSAQIGDLLPNPRVIVGVRDQHEVALRFADHKTIVHPELGPIELDCQILFTQDQTQLLLVFTAQPRSEAFEKLQLLAVLGQEHFPETERTASADVL